MSRKQENLLSLEHAITPGARISTLLVFPVPPGANGLSLRRQSAVLPLPA